MWIDGVQGAGIVDNFNTKSLIEKKLQEVSAVIDFGKDEGKEIFGDIFNCLNKLAQVVQDNEINDELQEWIMYIKGILEESESVNDDGYLWTTILFSYVVTKEILVLGGAGSKGAQALGSIKSALNEYSDKVESSKGSSFLNNKVTIDAHISFYEESFRFQLMEARTRLVYNRDLSSKIDEVLGDVKREVDNIEKDIARNKEVLEVVKNNTGYTALLSGFNEYNERIDIALDKIKGEIFWLKLALLLIPIFSFIASFSTADFKIYMGFFSLFVLLGYFLKIATRKEDQLDQIKASINSRTSLAVFHEYQVKNLEEGERLSAHEKFQNFIYSDIKTSEWHAPDVSENIANLIKAIKK